MGVFWSLFCNAVFTVLARVAIILMRKREMTDLLFVFLLLSACLCAVSLHQGVMVGLCSVIVAYLDHTLNAHWRMSFKENLHPHHD